MQKFIDILTAIPVATVKPFEAPAFDTAKVGDGAYMLAYSAKLIAAKATWDKENGVDEAKDTAIAAAHILATLPREKIAAAAEDARQRALILAGLVLVPMSSLVESVTAAYAAWNTAEDLAAKAEGAKGKAKAEADALAKAAAEGFAFAMQAKPIALWAEFVRAFRGIGREAEGQKDIARRLSLADSTSAAFYVALNQEVRPRNAADGSPHLRQMLAEMLGIDIPAKGK